MKNKLLNFFPIITIAIFFLSPLSPAYAETCRLKVKRTGAYVCMGDPETYRIAVPELKEANGTTACRRGFTKTFSAGIASGNIPWYARLMALVSNPSGWMNEIESIDCIDNEADCSNANARPCSLTARENTIQILSELKKPELEIRIPELTFSDLQKNVDEEGNLYLPWIGEFIAAIYKFGMGVVSIAAVVMIINQGFKITMSAGGEKKAEGFKRIAQILIGLVIAWGSYTILYYVNPQLVEFKALKVKFIEPDNDFIDKESEGYSGPARPITDSTYNSIFQKYAGCTGVDWRVLKVIAYRESGLQPNRVNEIGFQGLFQFKKSTCQPLGLGSKCDNLLDPDNSTAAGALKLRGDVRTIRSLCPNASTKDFFTLVYMAHNSGIGAVRCAAQKDCSVETRGPKQRQTIHSNGGCSAAEIEQGIKAFWQNHYKTKRGYRGADPGRGQRTYNYSAGTADLIMAQGVTQISAGSQTACPI